MKFTPVILVIVALYGNAQTPWPVLKNYDQDHIARIAMPVGGIGTGTISLGGNGQWKDVEIMNRPAKGFYGSTTSKQAPCFMIFTSAGGKKISKSLMGPISIAEYPGAEGSFAPNHGLPRFSKATFSSAYPFGRVDLDDEEMPVRAAVLAFNPLIPGDADASGIPAAIIRYEVTNKTDNVVTVAIAGSMDNFIGIDGSNFTLSDFNMAPIFHGANDNRNEFRKTQSLSGLYMFSDSVDKTLDTWGTLALTTNETNGTITFRKEFSPKGWNANITDMWDDFADDGMFRDETFQQKSNTPRGALSAKFDLPARSTRTIQFLLTWHFPNRKDWFNKGSEILGNYYANTYRDAWDVAEKILPQIPALEKKTADFVGLLLQSSYPPVVQEAALFNTSTLRTQTAFRTRDGNFFGWEGIFNNIGSCYGNCTHVWNYEQTSPFLFGSLARKMRDIEYEYGLNDTTGLMSFRVSLPLKKGINWKVAAADGQMGTIMKVYREWQLSGDNEFLKQKWPSVKKALAFAWIPGGWGQQQGWCHGRLPAQTRWTSSIMDRTQK